MLQHTYSLYEPLQNEIIAIIIYFLVLGLFTRNGIGNTPKKNISPITKKVQTIALFTNI